MEVLPIPGRAIRPEPPTEDGLEIATLVAHASVTLQSAVLQSENAGLRVGLSTMLLLAGVRIADAQPAASLVLLNGKIWTVNAAQPRAEAVACLGSRIVAVGIERRNPQVGRQPGTQVIDLGGKLVLPGFNDAHVHFFERRRESGRRAIARLPGRRTSFAAHRGIRRQTAGRTLGYRGRLGP